MDTSYSEAGPFMMIELPGPELDGASRSLIRRHRIRGVVLFQRNIVSSEQTRVLVSDLRAEIGRGALIAIDQEGGGVVRTSDLPFPPSAMCLGAAGDLELSEDVGGATGRALASLGINWDFAPVLDVNSNPENPVIADRSFGSDPDDVAEHALAWARGCRAAGVATCVKHFPGHGDTHVDSHLGLPVVDRSREELEALELRPFRRAVQDRTPCLMTAHILYPALDHVHPATLSRRILTDLLRSGWGYDGVIITDSMAMHAISRRYGVEEAAVKSLAAGADMVMALGSADDVERTASALSRAIHEGTIDADELAQKHRRLDELAREYPSRAADYPEDARLQDERLMAGAWANGLTAHGDPGPPPPGARVAVVVADHAGGGAASDQGVAGEEVVRALNRVYDVRPIIFDHAHPMQAAQVIDTIDRQDTSIIFVSTSRRRPDTELKQLIEHIKPSLHIALWNPYTVHDVPAPAIITYGFRPAALAAVVDWLAGKRQAEGRMPIEL